ncbi:MAG: peptidoglycan-binding protein [Microbacterium sp.]|uniref:peptidoglycan-binding protein n=1 Tax=Microbacterium sp. TaxID=51671 RepID=UPI0039E5B81B
MTGRRRRAAPLWATAFVAALVAVAVVALRPWDPPPSPAASPRVTAPVQRATLVSHVRLNGRLGYGDAVPLPAAAGMLTALPRAGAVVKTGERVYEADGQPVVLFRGKRPFWRDLSVQSPDGKDVRQLEQNLKRLGFFSGDPDRDYDAMTAEAVRDWQESLGAPRTGEFAAASVVVADAPGIRIASVSARLGEGNVSPATYTETSLRAIVSLTSAQARELVAGTPVTVVLPGGDEIDTKLAEVDPGGAPAGEGDEVTPAHAVVSFKRQSAVRAAGQAAVRVLVRDNADEHETLVVPVTALLATADEGYAVEVVDEKGVVRVPVEIGLVADARAQVLRSGSELVPGSGRSLAAGDDVVLAR